MKINRIQLHKHFCLVIFVYTIFLIACNNTGGEANQNKSITEQDLSQPSKKTDHISNLYPKDIIYNKAAQMASDKCDCRKLKSNPKSEKSCTYKVDKMLKKMRELLNEESLNLFNKAYKEQLKLCKD